MVDRLPRRSRRLHGLSVASAEPYSRRRRSNLVGDFHPIVSNTTESDPSFGVVVSMGGPSTSGILESTPLISRVFLAEEFQVEEVPQPLDTPSSPLPISFPNIILYGGPQISKTSSPPSFLSLSFNGHRWEHSFGYENCKCAYSSFN